MNIDYRAGDMFKAGHRFLAHGCNAKGVMGSGVALIVKNDYNYAYQGYKTYHDKWGLKLGGVVISEQQGEPTTIFNCITQNSYGTDQRYANYGAIQSCIRSIDNYLCLRFEDPKGIEVGFPMIGAGLAGGDWSIIANIIERESKNFQPVVYDFTP